MLLKNSLYWGKSFWICLVDFVADSFVSCMAMMEGGSWGVAIKSCKQGIAVLSEDAFHVMAYVSRLVRGSWPGGGVELGIGAGLGNVYSWMGSLYLMPQLGVGVVCMGMRPVSFVC